LEILQSLNAEGYDVYNIGQIDFTADNVVRENLFPEGSFSWSASCTGDILDTYQKYLTEKQMDQTWATFEKNSNGSVNVEARIRQEKVGEPITWEYQKMSCIPN
jgi:hypothetical protein